MLAGVYLNMAPANGQPCTVQGEKASLAKQGQEANGMKKEDTQPQHLMYSVSTLLNGHACMLGEQLTVYMHHAAIH